MNNCSETFFLDSSAEYVNLKKNINENKHLTKILNNPLPFTMNELDHLIKEGNTKQDIMVQYDIAYWQTLQSIIINLCKKDNIQYNIIQEKLNHNLSKKVIEMSKNHSLEEILTALHLKKTSFYSSFKKYFSDLNTYHDFLSELKGNLSKQRSDQAVDNIKKEKKSKTSLNENSSASSLSASNPDKILKLDIYHVSYLTSKDSNTLHDILSNGNMKLIPNLVIQNMLIQKKAKYYSLLKSISNLKNTHFDSFLEDDLFSFYTTKSVNEHDYYTKLALYFMRKGYQITLYCNYIPLLIDCLLLGIPVSHNVAYQYLKEGEKPLLPLLQPEYHYAYDTSFLKNYKVDFSTQQQKLICECVLEELNQIGAQNVIYYIIDNYQKPNTNIHIIPTCSAYSRINRYVENDNNILDYLQKYEVETGNKVMIYTTDWTFHWEALNLNFKTDELFDFKEGEEDSELLNTTLEKKEALTNTVEPIIEESTVISSIAITEYLKKHFILKDKVKTVSYDLKGNNLVPTQRIGESKYYKVAIGNYIHSIDNKVYKIMNYKLHNNIEEVVIKK